MEKKKKKLDLIHDRRLVNHPSASGLPAGACANGTHPRVTPSIWARARIGAAVSGLSAVDLGCGKAGRSAAGLA